MVSLRRARPAVQFTSTVNSPDASLTYREVYTHDRQGRLTEERSYVQLGAKFSPATGFLGPHRRILHYSQGNHWDQSMSYDSKGALVEKHVIRRDALGNELEDTKYDARLRIEYRVRYVYQLDTVGNWIEERKFWRYGSGPAAPERLEYIRYRAIDYFPPYLQP